MTTSSSTSLLPIATRISSSSLQVVSVHWLRSTIVGWDSFSSCCMIFEKWSREATIRQSLPFFLRPSRDLENSFLTSQSKSFTRCGSLKHWVHKTKWLWICYTSCEVINKWMNGATFYITPYPWKLWIKKWGKMIGCWQSLSSNFIQPVESLEMAISTRSNIYLNSRIFLGCCSMFKCFIFYILLQNENPACLLLQLSWSKNKWTFTSRQSVLGNLVQNLWSCVTPFLDVQENISVFYGFIRITIIHNRFSTNQSGHCV